jgi:hypothetical protein
VLIGVLGNGVTAVLEQAMATAANPHDMARRRRWHRASMVAAIAGSGLVLLAGVAAAQTRAEPPKPPSEPPAPAPAPATPADNPGFVGAFGNWMQQGMTSMSTGFDAMFGAAKGAADAAVDTAAGVTKLPVPGVAGGHEQCTLAGNGAPDCRVAAEALCRARGFATGTSVDFVTSEKCQPPYRSSGRRRALARWNISSLGRCANSRAPCLRHSVSQALCAGEAAGAPAVAGTCFLTSTA